ncbi:MULTISPECIES: NAD-dependent epimerase/dehydratase family protein [unclassified Agarivorans]|nr:MULTISPECIES: NAD-dependent epimerase/dehydratase family protein [unclassified Agarivorans]MDO6683891.1 NAD(P)H-binding protein [Agarivorans sp. 3_MG-2023]MDO6714376.1 NAD(P)H-binding protein [Agarivorans sp. 2_MG-2023]
MKTALILGISGNFGSEMAHALNQQGWQIKALMRNRAKAPSWLNEQHIIDGDASNYKQLSAAAEGADLIVYAVNPAYHRWQEEALSLLEPSVQVAEQMAIRLLFPGNVYNYSPTEQAIDESHQMQPITTKGKIRVAMEQRLRKAADNGAKITIVRAGDFIGPNTHLSWPSMLIKYKRNHTQMAFPHNAQHQHFWSYLPDLCANTIQVLELTQSDFEVWHDPGLRLSTKDWQQAFENNQQPLLTRKFAWWSFALLSLFVPTIKEVLKMRYLWRQPVLLDGSKMKQALGTLYQSTPLTQILKQLKPA